MRGPQGRGYNKNCNLSGKLASIVIAADPLIAHPQRRVYNNWNRMGNALKTVGFFDKCGVLAGITLARRA